MTTSRNVPTEEKLTRMSGLSRQALELLCLQAEHERDCAVEKLAELGKWAEYWANHKSDNPQDRGWSFAAQEVMQKLRATPRAATPVDVGEKL
jgi:hypothetical protein